MGVYVDHPVTRVPDRCRSAAGWVAGCAIVALLAGCTVQEGSSGVLLESLRVDSLGPTPVLPGTRLIINGVGFVPAEVAEMLVTLEGSVDGREVAFAVRPEWEDSTRLSKMVSGDIQNALMGANPGTLSAGAAFVGTLSVTRASTGFEPEQVIRGDVTIPLAATLGPTVTSVSPTLVRAGDTIVIEGAGFLHPSEGVSLVTFEGDFQATSPVATLPISGLVIPGDSPDPMRRTTLELPLTPDVFGVRAGSFNGVVRVRNELYSGAVITSENVSIDSIEVSPPEITSVFPLTASRGQRVDFEGLGLLPTDGYLEAGSLFVLEGQFTPARGPVESWIGDNVRALFPDFHTGNTTAGVVLRATKEQDGTLGGFGYYPGRFEGVITPLVFFGKESIVGLGKELVFDVAPPRQMVYLKLLPAFDDALTQFGLVVERGVVIQRLLDVLVRDYEGINIGFQTSPPAGYEEYAIVEVGGVDPNGSGLFGLDNTAGKDTGNERFDDVIGGFNADTRAQGYAAYGGIFVQELLNLSPRLSDSPLVSDRFDDVFAAFAIPLGGTPAEPGEALADGPRSLAIQAATIILGNLIGNTVAHEIGHSLGLAAVEGEFHNIGDSGPYLMDAGVYRPFEERAEIDGQGPAVFSPQNREYLETVLPVEL